MHERGQKVIEATGQTMVVVEHHIDVWLDLVDRVIVLGRPDASSPTGAVIADGKPDEVFAEMGDVLLPPVARGCRAVRFPITHRRGVCARCAGAQHRELKLWPWGRSWRWYQSGFYPGEVTALMGPERRGQIDLWSLTLAGLLKPIAGKGAHRRQPQARACRASRSTGKARELLGRIGMVFQEPEHQFAANFVRDEVAIGPKSMGQSQDEAYQDRRPHA